MLSNLTRLLCLIKPTKSSTQGMPDMALSSIHLVNLSVRLLSFGPSGQG